MVKIPIATSRSQLTTRTTAPKITDVSSFTRTSRALTSFGIQLAAITEQVRKVRNATQSKEAGNKALRSLSQTQLDYQNDPNILETSNQQAILDRIRRSGADSAGGIEDGNARDSFLARQEQNAIIAEFQFKDFVKDKQFVQSTAALSATFETTLQAAINAPNEKAAAIIARGYFDAADVDIGLGSVDREKTLASKVELVDKIRFGRAQEMALNNPDVFLAVINEFGLKTDEKKLLESLANTVSDNNAQRARRQQTKVHTKTSKERTLDLFAPNRNDAKLIKDLTADFDAGRITETSFKAKIKAIQAGTGEDAINDSFTLITLGAESMRLASKDNEGFYENAKSEDIAEFEAFFIQIANASAAKLIKPDKANTLLKPLIPVVEKALDDAALEKIREDNPKEGWNHFLVWVDNMAPEGEQERVKAELMIRLFKLLEDPKQNVEEAVNKVIEGAQKESNPNRTQYKIGQTVNTSSGMAVVKDFDLDGEPLMELLEKVK